MIHHTPLGVCTSISISGNKKINLDKKTCPMPPTKKSYFPSYKKPTPIGGGGCEDFSPQPPQLP